MGDQRRSIAGPEGAPTLTRYSFFASKKPFAQLYAELKAINPRTTFTLVDVTGSELAIEAPGRVQSYFRQIGLTLVPSPPPQQPA